MPFVYRAAVLAELARHGVQPRATTPPELVHGFVNDLYRFELRRLRARLIRREFPKARYSALVTEVRERYRLLAMKPHQWLEPRTDGPTGIM